MLHRFVFFLMVLASPALSQLDTGTDGMGVYFDEGATTVSMTTDVIDYHVAYLVLVHPSEEGSLQFFGASVESPGIQWPIDGITRFGENLFHPMPGDYSMTFSVVANGGDPFFLTDVTVLAEVYVIPQVSGSTDLFLKETPVYSIVDQLGPLVQCHPSSGNFDLPVATINGPEPVSVLDLSWGNIKSLFR